MKEVPSPILWKDKWTNDTLILKKKKILKDKMWAGAKVQFLCIESSLSTDYPSCIDTWGAQ